MIAMHLNATIIRDQAAGKWREILTRLGMALPLTAKQHGPCPACGGKDRFRFDDEDGHGSWFCNQCTPQAGDGFALVQKVRGCDFPGALQLVADAVGYHPGNGNTPRKIVATYDYTDASGTILFQAMRYVPKDFRQRRPDGHGGWIWNLTGIEPVLYKLPEVLAASSVMIVEGEKDVETAYRLGLPEGWAATCNPMGAGKWRESYSDALRGKHVVILPDVDAPGEKHAVQVAESLHGKAATVLRLTLPDGCKDLSEWAETGSTAPVFHSLLNNVQQFVFVSTPKNDPPHESYFHPVAASVLLAEPPEEIEWILDEYLPAGGLVLLAGKPKEGKTTLSYELAVSVAQGSTFLGRQTRKGAVLILALEEHARDVRMRLHHLGASSLDGVFVHTGPLEPTATVLDDVMSFAKKRGVTLILADTLSAFWKIRDENDAAEMTKVVKPLLQLARESGACVVLIHHARKSEGSYGDEIRGSGALFAAVDVALIMKRHEVQTQRLLQAQSRYSETPSELVLELRESGYVALGDPASVGKAARLAKLTESLPDQWEEADAIAKRAGLSQRDGYRLLTILVEEGKALRDGKGKKGSPYRFTKNAIHAPPQPYRHESNFAKADSINAAPPSPCTNSSEAEGKEECREPEGLFTEEVFSDDN